MRDSTGSLLVGLSVASVARGANRLSKKREGELTLTAIMLGPYSILVLSRPAGRLSCRVIR